ncbi:YibE/F family protein [Candidatus Berkelbacteria bacterium]|nr:YibE/F family protein [Candidatus Berkelbacteria bacterium]
MNLGSALVLAGLVLSLTGLPAALAQAEPVLEPDPALVDALPADRFTWAQVITVLEEGVNEFEHGFQQPFQRLRMEITSGPDKGVVRELEHGTKYTIQPSDKLEAGERFILGESTRIDGSTYLYVADRARTAALGWLVVVFMGLVVAVSGRQGFLALVGLALSIGILAWYVVPQIAAGQAPVGIALVGAFLIASATLYLAHGIRWRTTVALASLLFTLLIAVGLSTLFAALAHLSGTGSEAAFYAQLGSLGSLDLRGLLLAGIILGTLGVLDDVTTTQAATVEELKRAKPSLSARALFARGMSVGREHVASLVNTLALAYAAVGLPLFLIAATTQTVPFWVTLNSEFVVEEALRTLAGSSAIVLAVPVTTFLATLLFTRRPPDPDVEAKHPDVEAQHPDTEGSVPHFHS